MLTASRIFRTLLVATLISACQTPSSSTTPPEAAANKPAELPAIDLEQIRHHLTFLADDAQGGRAPGTEGDRRVQEHIIKAMTAAGLTPGLDGQFRQPFSVTDGVRLRDGAAASLAVAGAAIPHAVLPFGHDTHERGPVQAKLVFVGYGIRGDGPESGDYKGLGAKVKGNIVVALGGGPNDPHLEPARTRPQSKLIAARDHGAVGFVLWEPDTDHAFPNHGKVSDLELPALWVGKAGTPALAKALRAKNGDPKALAAGARSRKRAELHTPVTPIELETANIGGRLAGPAGAKTIVVGAHMDHLGLGTSSSLAPGEEAVHNGADDNASGVATMLAVAQALATIPAERRKYDVLFVAFGAEEMGLLGSKHLVGAWSPEQRANQIAMIQLRHGRAG